MKRRGNCYVACEALYHLLGGKRAGWLPIRCHFSGDTHWALKHRASGLIVDPTANQFGTKRIPYETFRGSGFLTGKPSVRARELMEKILWQRT